MGSLKHIRPALLQGITVAAIMGGGDIISQTLVEKQKYDAVRTIKFASLGLVFVGPAIHFWYIKLDKLVPPKKSLFKRGVHKMLYDQLLFAPPFTLAITTIFGVLNGDSSERIKKRVTEEYPGIMLKNYMLWPAAQIINFSLIPIQFQVGYCQIVALIWNCVLSKTLNQA